MFPMVPVVSRRNAAFFAAIREGQASPIPFDEIVEVLRVTLALA